MNSNSENPGVGKAFQGKVHMIMEKCFSQKFIDEQPVLIGNPPKPHKFDMVSDDGQIIVECKCYTWTKSGNVPSAKLSTLDEAVLYMRSVTYKAKKIIAMRRDLNEKRRISLAEYFCDKKGHLLDDIEVWEIDDEDNIKVVNSGVTK